MKKSIETVINSKMYPSLIVYLRESSSLAEEIYNQALFVQRQLYISYNKDEDTLSDNEKEVLSNISSLGISHYKYLGYTSLERYMREYHHDLFKKNMSSQCVQNIIRQVCRDMKSYKEAIDEYYKDPDKFLEMPELPRYSKKKCKSYFITNQDAHIYHKDDGYYLKFPYIKDRLYIGIALPDHFKKMKQVNIRRYYDTFKISIVYDTEVKEKGYRGEGIIGIDLGVDNFIAIAGMNESILVNGKVIKSRNQYYNKEKARLYSIYDRQNGDTRHRNGRKLRQLNKKRSNWMNNYMHHCSRYVVNYCRAHSVGTIVIGKNDGWKQKSSLGRKTNQEFVSIPYNSFINLLRYYFFKKIYKQFKIYHNILQLNFLNLIIPLLH